MSINNETYSSNLLQLGKSDIFVNPIIMGCWQIGGGAQWKNIDDQTSEATLLSAVEHGINTFDTAPGYGFVHSKIMLGKTLRSVREKIIISDKVFADKLKLSQVIKSCEESLKLLKTDYIDLF